MVWETFPATQERVEELERRYVREDIRAADGKILTLFCGKSLTEEERKALEEFTYDQLKTVVLMSKGLRGKE